VFGGIVDCEVSCKGAKAVFWTLTASQPNNKAHLIFNALGNSIELCWVDYIDHLIEKS
jgi:hypothetical protein